MKLTEQSLMLLDGISSNTEIAMRSRGYLTIKLLYENADILFGEKHAERIKQSYQYINKAIMFDRVDILLNNISCGYRARILHDYYDQALFFDIETDGIGPNSEITIISACLNGEMNTYVKDENLYDFIEIFDRAKILVGFNSKHFDTPLVSSRFKFTTLPAQIDLMHEAGHYGYKGGLKAIEKMIGYKRKNSEGVTGEDAVSLWHSYKASKNRDFLNQLIAYNQEDVYSLIKLYHVVLKHSLENTRIVL